MKNIFLCSVKEWSAKFKESMSIKLNVLMTYFLKCLRQLPDLTLSFNDLGDQLDWKTMLEAYMIFVIHIIRLNKYCREYPKIESYR